MGGASVRRFRKAATTTLLWAHSVRPYTRLQGHADQERETWKLERGTRWSKTSARGARVSDK